MINDKALWDMIWIVRSNRKKLFWMIKRDTIRLGLIVSKLTLLDDIDERFSKILDNLTEGTLITLNDYDYFVSNINLLDENIFNLIWENKQDIINFFDSIRSDISEVMPKTYFNDKVTWIMEAGFQF